MSEARSGKASRLGEVESLYEKLRRGRRAVDGLSKEEVAADQRRRLQGAMIEAVDRHGYQRATGREMCRLAGVSERALYERFKNKEGCFLATYDSIVLRGVERIGAAYRAPGAWEAKLRAAFGAYAKEVVDEPKAARLVLVEVLGAGPRALARLRGTRLIFERIVSTSFAEAPDGVVLPPLIAKGIVCGVERVTRQLLLSGRVGELPEHADDLLAWALSYRSPSAAALAAAAAEHDEWHAPGRPSAGVENDRACILRCAARIAAANGYARLTPAQIVQAADVSEATFDELFESTEQCFLEALDRLGLEALVCAARASRTSDDRLTGAHRGMVALMRHVAQNPVLLRVAFVEIFDLGAAGIERRERLLGHFTELLVKSLPRTRRTSDLAAEASVGAIWGLVHHYVTRGATRQLPELAGYATYIALAPAIGGEAAIQVIRTSHDVELACSTSVEPAAFRQRRRVFP